MKEMLPGNDNDYLLNLEAEWHAGKFHVNRYCAYETRTTRGVVIVDRLSGTRNCESSVPVDADHETIVKPCSVNDESYIAFLNAWEGNPIPRPIVASAKKAASKPSAPAPVNNLTAQSYSEPELREGPVSALSQPTPCSTDHTVLQMTEPMDAPNLKAPALVPEVKRVIFRSTRDPNRNEILLEVSVTNRGTPSIARGWRYCEIEGGKPIRYLPADFTPEDPVKWFSKDRVSLVEASINAPIETGHAVTGWLLFRTPTAGETDSFIGALEFRDYLGKDYQVAFTTTPGKTDKQ